MAKEKSGYIPIYQTGIGRPADPNWLEWVADTFHRTTSPSTKLIMRKKPGISYVVGNKLYSVGYGGHEALSEDQREPLIEELARNVVSSLCNQGVLNRQTVESNLTLPMKRHGNIKIRQGKRHAVLGIMVDDVPTSDTDPTTWVVQAENYAVEEAFGIPHESVEKKYPKHFLGLGKQLGYLGMQDKIDLETAIREEPIPLLGLGTVRLDTLDT